MDHEFVDSLENQQQPKHIKGYYDHLYENTATKPRLNFRTRFRTPATYDIDTTNTESF